MSNIDTVQSLVEKLTTSDNVADARSLCKEFIQNTEPLSREIPRNIQELLFSLLQGFPLSEQMTQELFLRYTGTSCPEYLVAVCSLPDSNLISLPAYCWQIPYQGNLIVLCGLGSQGEEIQSYLQRHTCSGGISRPFSRLTDLRIHYHQALSTLNTLVVLGRTPGVAMYDDFLMIRMLEGLRSDVDIEDFVLPDIEQLRSYDKKHNSQLARTLLTYLERSKNVASTAQALHIHRNTVHYRVNKCIELLPELDFSNEYITFLLMLSLHIAEYDFYLDQKAAQQSSH